MLVAMDSQEISSDNPSLDQYPMNKIQVQFHDDIQQQLLIDHAELNISHKHQMIYYKGQGA